MIRISVDGVKKTMADLEKGEDRTRRRLPRVVTQLVTIGQEEAKALCPVDTGNLRNSITVELRGLSGSYEAEAHYGVYVEFGTSKMRPQPYMIPSIRAVEQQAEQLAVRAVRI